MKTSLHCLCTCLLILCATFVQAQFITTWQVNSNGKKILIPVNPNISGYDYSVNWGDGNKTSGHNGNASHIYATAGTYTGSISGDFPVIQFGSSSSGTAKDQKLRTIVQWGAQIWQSMEEADVDCSNFTTESDSDAPIFAPQSSLFSIFRGCSNFNSNLNDWDVSNVTNMRSKFNGASSFNQDIGNWAVSNIENMGFMFFNAQSFNQNIGDWDVSNVTKMESMFSGGKEFNQDISNWEVSQVTNMRSIFNGAERFNHALTNWDVGNVTSLEKMFNRAVAINQDLGSWNVVNVVNKERMFYEAYDFDQNIGEWNVSMVTNMQNMLDKSGMSSNHYDETLNGWAAQNVQPNVTLQPQGLAYCAGASARESLITSKGWTIEGDNPESPPRIDPDPNAFVMTWSITLPRGITIPINPSITGYNYTVDWGDGSSSSSMFGNATHVYANAGTYTISITGNFPAIQFGNVSSDANNDKNLISIEQWGAQSWLSMHKAFSGCNNLTTMPDPEAPDLSKVSDMSYMFSNTQNFNYNISHWNVSNVTNMEGMFSGATNFNQDINGWNVSNVTNMEGMFSDATNFNQDINGWNVSNVTNMQRMFLRATNFNQDINGWNVSNVTNMEGMFYGTTNFNQNINGWNVSNVLNFNLMFAEAVAFNQNIGTWNVSNATNMEGMFFGAANFNHNLSGWDVGNVTDMAGMFGNASIFNQDLGTWAISKVTNMEFMLSGSGLSMENYDKTLTGWASQNVQPNVSLGAHSMIYCTSAPARTSLIDTNGWNITGDTYDAECKRLPITILAFKAQEGDEVVRLSWTINSDEPIRQLMLQKSYDGVHWTAVYQENLLNYPSGDNVEGSYTDHEMTQSRMLYRLYITEVSGAATFSQVLPVTMIDQGANTVYYNQANQRIIIKAGQNFAGRMQLINVRGQNVMTKNMKLLKNTNQEIEVDRYLSAGIYFLRFENHALPPTRIFVY